MPFPSPTQTFWMALLPCFTLSLYILQARYWGRKRSLDCPPDQERLGQYTCLLERLPTCLCISCVHVFMYCISNGKSWGAYRHRLGIPLKNLSPNILFYLHRYFLLPAAIKKWFLVKKFKISEPTTFFYSLTPNHKSHSIGFSCKRAVSLWTTLLKGGRQPKTM